MQMRDSAGVILADMPDVQESVGSGWTVSSEPSLVLRAGADGEELFQVTGARVLPDGRIAVCEESTGRISVFGSDGTLLRSHGRKGEGPGEYKWPVIAGVLGTDTIVIVDSPQRRLSLVHASDGFLTSSMLRSNLGSPVTPRGMFGDRTVVIGGGHSWSARETEMVTSGYSRPRTRFRSARLDGSLATDFGEFPGAEMVIEVSEAPNGGSSMSADMLPFGKRAVTAVGIDLLYVGTQDAWEIRAFDTGGTLRKVLRLDRMPRRVRSGDVDALIREAVDESSGRASEPSIRRSMSRLPIPETLPAFSSLHADTRGFIWVGRYRTPGESATVFDVVSPDGYLVAAVSLAAGNRILHIADEFVLTLHRDEFDVESVRLYRLVR